MFLLIDLLDFFFRFIGGGGGGGGGGKAPKMTS